MKEKALLKRSKLTHELANPLFFTQLKLRKL